MLGLLEFSSTVKNVSAPLGSCVGIGESLLSKMEKPKASGAKPVLGLVERSTWKVNWLPGVNVWMMASNASLVLRPIVLVASPVTSPNVMQFVGQAAAFPAKLGRQGGDLHLPAARDAQGGEDVVVGERQVAVCLELAVHLIGQAELHPDVGEPGTLLVAAQPDVRRG